jgi:hypothetical protein
VVQVRSLSKTRPQPVGSRFPFYRKLTYATAARVDEAVLTSLLEFTYLILSPRPIGATIVWLLRNRNPFAGQGGDLTPLLLDHARIDRLLGGWHLHITSQRSMTVQRYVSREGNVLATAVQQLTVTDRARQLVASSWNTT